MPGKQTSSTNCIKFPFTCLILNLVDYRLQHLGKKCRNRHCNAVKDATPRQTCFKNTHFAELSCLPCIWREKAEVTEGDAEVTKDMQYPLSDWTVYPIYPIFPSVIYLFPLPMKSTSPDYHNN